MAVLLEELNIPEGNPITINIYRDGTWVNAYTTEDGNAIEVPEPHGRLIDADALAEDLNYDVENDQRALDQMDFVGKEREHIQFDKDCKQNCMWYLSEALTVIPANSNASNALNVLGKAEEGE